MVSPITAYRDMRALSLGKIQNRPLSALENIALTAIFVVTILAIVWVIRSSGIGRAHFAGKTQRNVYVMIFASALTTVPGMFAWGFYRRLRDGGTDAFAFPAFIPPLGYRILQRDRDAALYLTNGLLLVALLARATDETLEQVLEAIDPDAELEADDPQGGMLRFDVPGQPAAHGLIRSTASSRAFIVIVAETEHAAQDLASLFARVAPRKLGRKPQKWRPLDPPTIATARAA